MNTNEHFLAFFAGPFQYMLDTTEIPGMHGASWDRKAAWLLYNEGNTDMPRGGGRKKAVNEIAGKLLEVMNFLDVGYKASGNLQANTTVFFQGWGFSFDGVIAAGSPTVQGFTFDGAVNTVLFKEALARVGKDMDLTISDAGAHFSSTEFEAVVPVVPLHELSPVNADPAVAPFPQGTNFVGALEMAGRAIRDSAENVRDAAIMTNGYTVLSTNGAVVVEVHHGNSMPSGLLFPKAFATALHKVGREPKSFGFGQNTFTVYYEDGSFIRTQTYPIDAYPAEKILSMLDMLMTAPMAIPPVKGLFEAIEKTAPFADEQYGLVWFTGGSVKTGPADAEGWTSEVDVKDLPEGVGANAKGLLMFKSEIKSIWLGNPEHDNTPARVVMYGDNFRAAVNGMRLAPVETPATAPDPVPPTAQNWGTGQTSETPPPPPGWGPQAAPTGGAPTTEAHAEPSASGTTAQVWGTDQQAPANAGVSPSNPFPIAHMGGSAPGTDQMQTPAPDAAPDAQNWGNVASPSEPSWGSPGGWGGAPFVSTEE